MRMNERGPALMAGLLVGIMLLIMAPGLCHADLVWFDGSKDEAEGPPGKLLSGNAGYWGECVLTGITCAYEATQPNAPVDRGADTPEQRGRVLLDGKRRTGVGLSGGKPLTVILDLKRICDFAEWDIITPTKRVSITIETRESEDGGWNKVYERSIENCPEAEFHRMEFAKPVRGRFVRLTLGSPGKTLLNEILAWGDSAEDVPEDIAPVATGQYPVGVTFPTITGISKSAVSDRESFYWVKSLKPEHQAQDAVWAAVPTWSSISHQPVLPKPESINPPIHIVMARNETETVALALRNTLVDSPRNVEVKLSSFMTPDGRNVPGLSGKASVFGTIGSRNYGNNLGPIFEADNLLGKSLMSKYLLNGNEIRDFPRIALPPSGGAVIWLSVTSRDAGPGIYRADLRIAGGQALPVTVEVLDVALPMTFAHIHTFCGNRTSMFPFEHSDRSQRDFAHALDSGISDWHYSELVRKMAADRGMKILYRMGFLIPHWSDPAKDYVGMIWQGRWKKAADFPEDAPQQVAKKVKRVVEAAEALGLTYDQWYGQTVDEPGTKNIDAIAYMCRLIKETDPKVNIHVNPCFWAGFDKGGVSDDATVARALQGTDESAHWYREFVDISMPLMLLLRGRPDALKEFSSPRLINTYYYVSGHLDRSEQGVEIQKYRRMAWDSFASGFNGWSFYAWYSPRGNPWDHFDKDGREPSDYQIVYPGPRGVILTRHSEALREGWEDYRLLTALRQRGQQALVDKLLAGYRAGEPLADLRRRALRACLPTGARKMP
jgi:hypothetical protein